MNTGVAVLILQALRSGTRGLNVSSHQHQSFPQRAGKVHGQCGQRRPRNRMSCSQNAIGSCFCMSDPVCRCSCSLLLTRRKALPLGYAGAHGAIAEARCQEAAIIRRSLQALHAPQSCGSIGAHCLNVLGSRLRRQAERSSAHLWEGEGHMAHYLFQGGYAPEAWAGLMENPTFHPI